MMQFFVKQEIFYLPFHENKWKLLGIDDIMAKKHRKLLTDDIHP